MHCAPEATLSAVRSPLHNLAVSSAVVVQEPLNDGRDIHVVLDSWTCQVFSLSPFPALRMCTLLGASTIWALRPSVPVQEDLATHTRQKEAEGQRNATRQRKEHVIERKQPGQLHKRRRKGWQVHTRQAIGTENAGALRPR